MFRSRELLVPFVLLAAGCSSHAPATSASAGSPARVEITVDGDGYHPDHVSVPAGRETTLVFTRTTDETCAKEVVFPSLHLRRALPLNQPVAVAITPPAGTLSFACGMDMVHGEVVAH